MSDYIQEGLGLLGDNKTDKDLTLKHWERVQELAGDFLSKEKSEKTFKFFF